MAAERVLGQQRRRAPRQIAEEAGHQGRGGRASGGHQLVPEAMDDGAAARDQVVRQADRDGQLLLRGQCVSGDEGACSCGIR